MLKLRATHLSWINGQVDDPTDQCAHGKVELKVDDSILIEPGEAEFTLSAAGLYLLRTIEDDHTPESSVCEGNWLFPCCGFDVFADGGRYKVACMGCNTGTDIFVRHQGNSVVLSAGERLYTVSLPEWRASVLGFVAQVDAFYAACTPKVNPEDPAWSLFWDEWHERKLRAASGA